MKTSRIGLILAMAMSALITADAPRPQPAPVTVDAVAASHPLQAARLRKLHLVRPDLINYPLSFDVVC